MANHLIQSKSSYLKQHAQQAIAWYPWSEQALKIAKTTDKPIFMSIGYASCHWCHVMAEEVFNDPAVAKYLNQHFIAIKVDREQRPDLDSVYMISHQLLTGQSGGWPLNLFLDPDDQVPFYSGTYFPLAPKQGLPSFLDVLHQVFQFYHAHREVIKKQSKRLQLALHDLAKKTDMYTEGSFNLSLLTTRRDYLAKIFDGYHGGFGHAPKFAHPYFLLSLLEHYQQSLSSTLPDELALAMVEKSLQAMGHGGLQDHVGGGFFRYCVDEAWQMPHFEKMLYDQASLLTVYSYAYFITQKPWYKMVAKRIYTWTDNHLYVPEEAYVCAQDADSDGEEGGYYLWSKEELTKLLSADDYAWLSSYLALTPIEDAQQKIHLQWQQPWPKSVSDHHGLLEPYASYQRIMQELALMRHERIAPTTDDNILTSWNGLYLSALFRASIWLHEPDCANQAFKVLDFIESKLWHDKQLTGYWHDMEAQPGLLNDYAFLLEAVLLSLQVEFHTKHWQFALTLAEHMIAYFYDASKEQFYDTSTKLHESLIYRTHQDKDEMLPSGIGVAIDSLLTLASWAKRPQWTMLAETALRHLWQQVEQNPAYYPYLIRAGTRIVKPMPLLILRGERETVKQWQQSIQTATWGQCEILPIANQDDIPPLFAAYQPKGLATAWYCDERGCQAPWFDFDALNNFMKTRFSYPG